MTILPGCKFLGDVGHGLAEHFDRQVCFVGRGPHLFDFRVGLIVALSTAAQLQAASVALAQDQVADLDGFKPLFAFTTFDL